MKLPNADDVKVAEQSQGWTLDCPFIPGLSCHFRPLCESCLFLWKRVATGTFHLFLLEDIIV